MSSSSGSNIVGDAEAVPAANDGGCGGVNIRLYEGHETDYITSLIQDSVKLETRDIHTLLTNHEMPILPVIPHRPQPPALFMVPNQLVLDGIADGYIWRKRQNINGVNVIKCSVS
ncbi:PREDICTED: uncharacterized protein LOC104786139 isoform X2 [Camelina sativa]|uniref:Uncharacterized protein LOC104786139 isoform X2 n=1 Tax=Camelina sativa TaxID=90675 RepID=A0ABM1RCZ9_CAMSA|nr:PREDICTED: uncharacterized protein LOC104786139 isoform X2 [Camelina sativa]